MSYDSQRLQQVKKTQTPLKVLMAALVDLLCLMLEVFKPLICGLVKALKFFGEACNYRMSVQFHWSARLSAVFCCDDYKCFRLSSKCVISIKRSRIRGKLRSCGLTRYLWRVMGVKLLMN